MKWQEVKDLFREQVGDVTYVELFQDESDKPRGCGILEFGSEELAQLAVEKMHRHELRGRKLVVKEDFDTDRDKHGRIIPGGGNRRGGSDRDRGDRDRSMSMGSVSGGGGGGGHYGNTYGLSPQFLESLGIDGPLHNRLFVANVSFTTFYIGGGGAITSTRKTRYLTPNPTGFPLLGQCPRVPFK